jgi:hypothetical protein
MLGSDKDRKLVLRKSRRNRPDYCPQCNGAVPSKEILVFHGLKACLLCRKKMREEERRIRNEGEPE